MSMGMGETSIWVCLIMLAKPLKPMVLLIILPFLNGYFIGNINPTFSDTPICSQVHWIGLFGKILTGNHDVYHQIYGFPVKIVPSTFYDKLVSRCL